MTFAFSNARLLCTNCGAQGDLEWDEDTEGDDRESYFVPDGWITSRVKTAEGKVRVGHFCSEKCLTAELQKDSG